VGHRAAARGPGTLRLLLWAGALALALSFVAVDGTMRLRTIGAVSVLAISDVPPPLPDPASPTGYIHGQHRLLLPSAATDGYHWILQTEQMLAVGGLRVRATAVDNAPYGREVHWSSPVRWWLGGLAAVRAASRPSLTPAQAIEQVAPAAVTIMVALLLIILVPVVAWRFGAAAGALVALAWVGVFPLYETMAVGMLDHHGLAYVCCFAAIVCILGGGAGWVRDSGRTGTGVRRIGEADDGLAAWLPDARGARRWYVAAGVAGGIGLWISAVTMVPVLAALGAAALLSTGVFARARRGGEPWRPEPGLWRVWGIAGAATSLAAWLVEYFPGHFVLRLEVNHPLHALAWLGAGDLVARLCTHLARPRGVEPLPEAKLPLSGQAAWIAADVLLIAAAPVAVLAGGAATFQLADPFLRALHHAHIVEFQPLAAQLAEATLLHILQGPSALPLVLLPLAVLLAPSLLLRPRARVPNAGAARTQGGGRDAPGARVLAAAMIVVGVAYVHFAAFSTIQGLLDAARMLPGDGAGRAIVTHAAILPVDAAALALLCLLPARAAVHRPDAPCLALLAMAAVPAVVLVGLAFWQVRWLGTAAAALVALLVAATTMRHAGQPSGQRRVHTAVAALLVLAVLPGPLFAALFAWRHGYSATAEAPQAAARDLAYVLRQRMGSRDAIIASAPTTTSWLIYFGGFRGIGTLYWENLAGLRAAASIFSAPTEEHARSLVERHRVTHIVIPSWEPVDAASVALVPGRDGRRGRVASDGFLVRLTAGELPPWLAAVSWELPPARSLHGLGARVYEVVSLLPADSVP
jgi:hypothetical protein